MVAVRSNASEANAKVPTLEVSQKLPVHVSELSNESLYILAEQGCHDACQERLVRHVMVVDGVEWITAKDKVKEIGKANHQLNGIATLPYKVGIGIGVTSGIACVPLCFHLPTVQYFNKVFVTTDVPEPDDLQTWFEVGSWAWNWMEPPLGVASFVLLAMQFTRAQMQNMDMKPYTEWVKNYRADRLHKLYPLYNEDIIKDFAQTASLGSS
mmetsp:Transcript_129361/g.335426  ORF Transcript_129361/g.335426 Transcript_129361/m.335426 type:complete len:211 (-) Transcript_129361:316-948(-)